MLEVSASWLFHAAMNILWERKYLVSDFFYSVATHRAGNLPDLAKIKITAFLSSRLLLHRLHQGPALLRYLVLSVNGPICKTHGVQFAILMSTLRQSGWLLISSAPLFLSRCLSSWVGLEAVGLHQCFLLCPFLLSVQKSVGGGDLVSPESMTLAF